LAVGVGLTGVLIALATLSSQRHTSELRLRLNQLQGKSSEIADHFRSELRELNNLGFAYGVGHEPAVWAVFRQRSHDLDDWIDHQKPVLTTESERRLLEQIDRAYDDYQRVATELHTRLQPAGARPTSVAEFTDFLRESQRLFQLGHELADAHLARREQLLTDARERTTQLRQLVLGSLALLFLFGTALATLVYRDMIAPLRLKLVQSQEMAERQEKLASLGILAAGVAHEIRNPLTAIKAAVYLQAKRSVPGSPQHDDAKLVEREISRLERIVNDFLLFARPSEPVLARFSTEVPLREVHSLLQPTLAASRIQLVLEPSPALSLQADPAQIKQVLINLVQNAADSIGQDGVVTLRARAERRRLANGETEVAILEISDTGKGITPEAQKRLFDPFFTTKERGTGLGLSIAARIVEKHGGALQYRTLVNHGTTFGVVLPQAKPGP
jgi:signal transduction histidine kinase